MLKDIPYGGHTAQPSGYSSSDGDLALSLDAISENGALQPLFQPKSLFSVGEDETVAYVHSTSSYTHFIIVDRREWSVRFRDKSTGTSTVIGTLSGESSFTSIGNTLVALSGSGMRYFLFKPDSGLYTDLGSHLPELCLQFGLEYSWEKSDRFGIDYAGHYLMYDKTGCGSGFGNVYDDSAYTAGMPNSDYITQCVLGQANKFIAEEATDKGRFIYPFFVRYAYRLYDGSYVMQSSPVLMPCVTGCSPIPLVTGSTYDGNGDAHGYYKWWELMIVAPVFDLMYKVADSGELSVLRNWGDIVKSVDIFISKPIYTYDINGEITQNKLCSTVNFTVNGKESGGTAYDTVNAFTKLYSFAASEGKLIDGRYFITPLPAKSSDAVASDIKDTSNFFLLKSYKLEELAATSGMTKVEIEEDYLQSLVNREQLTDDYDSHDTLVPSKAFAYNQRLNLSGITKHLFDGFPADGLMAYQTTGNTVGEIYVWVKQEGKDIVVRSQPHGTARGDLCYFYYPNANAYKARVGLSDGSYHEYTLSAHSFLNGAYFFSGFGSAWPTGYSVPSATASPTVDLPNKIYTSQVSNPFYFSLGGINTVGVGKIIGISAATKALSQGQFGQFPLYAFSTDGIWALEVGSDGLYTARQPVSRDVCVDANSITQMDSSVMFVTDRGIMHISGSTTECISDIIETSAPWLMGTLPKSKELVEIYNNVAGEGGVAASLSLQDVTLRSFSDFLSGCGMVYDYVHQHVIVYNPEVAYAYVFSMKSKCWGMIRSSIVSSVNSYPQAMVMATVDGEPTLCDFSYPGASSVVAFVVTRPLKFGDGGSFKTVESVIQRGTIVRGDVRQVLYGSNDMANWLLVWSSSDMYLRGFSGSSYKYYRLAVLANLGEGKSLTGCTVSVEGRLSDQQR